MWNYNFNDISEYLRLAHPKLIREKVWALLLIANISGVLLAVCDPFNKNIFNIMVIILLLVDLFGIYILSNAKKRQKQYSMFVGIYCFGISILYLITFYKFVYLALKISNPIFMITALSIYLLILILVGVFVSVLLKRGFYSSGNKKNKMSILWGASISLGASGMIVGKMLLRSYEGANLLVVPVFFLVVGYAFETGIHNIYKYYLIKKFNPYIREFQDDEGNSDK